MGFADRDQGHLASFASGDLFGLRDTGVDIGEQGGWIVHAALL